jgi:Xaa-Pro aminopeptidase
MALFDQSEYEKRIDRTKERMADRGLDVLLVSGPANMNYLSGYDGWSFYVHQLLVITRDRDEPIWIGRDMDAIGARKTVWLSEENIRPYGDEYVQSGENHPMSFVAEVLDDEGVANATIGVELDTYYFSALSYVELTNSLPNAKFEDATYLVRRVRAVKSDREIQFMEQAGEVVSAAIDTALDTVGEGIRECDVAAEVYRTLIRGTDEFGGDYPAMNPMLSSGENANVPHFTWSDRDLSEGDCLTMEIAGSVHHYNAPLARTFFVGEAPEKAYRTAETIVDGVNAVIDAIEPGITAEEVETAWQNSLADAPLGDSELVNLKGGKARIGYAAGLGYPPDWGEHTISIREGDKTVLEPNMTFHIFPAIRYEDFGIEISETIRVTEDGAEPLADVPQELFVV